MLGAHLNPAQQGIPLLVSIISGCAVLQRGQQLVAMQWHHAVIVVSHCQQHGRPESSHVKLETHLDAAQQGVPLLIGLVSGSAVLQHS